MKTNIILSIGLLFALVITTAQAQDLKEACPCETDYRISMITEEDYPNFLNISALKKYSNVIYRGLDSDPAKVHEYRLSGHAKNISIDAFYGKDGKLVTARLVKKNTPLPKIISQQLVSDAYKDWTMRSNKTFVKDFDAMSTEYEVKMKNGKNKLTLFFDSAGNQINRLAINR